MALCKCVFNIIIIVVVVVGLVVVVVVVIIIIITTIIIIIIFNRPTPVEFEQNLRGPSVTRASPAAARLCCCRARCPWDTQTDGRTDGHSAVLIRFTTCQPRNNTQLVYKL